MADGSSGAVRFIGLFPYFDADRSRGGIQASALAAWEALRAGVERTGGSALLFRFGGSGEAASTKRPQVMAASRTSAVIQALRWRGRARRHLFWHAGLLKLRPFLGHSPAVVFLHGIEAWRRFGWLERKLLLGVDLFLSNSDHTWHRFIQANPEFDRRPHKTVPLGLGAPLAELETSEPDAEPSMVMVSRLERAEDYKGHREVIQAWPRVLRAQPEARLWIVGDGDLRPRLERLAREASVGGSIHFLGRVDEARKNELIRRSRCLALPSRGEGFGLVYLEAMRLGRPCLVSDCDAGREVVAPPEAGLAVDPSDPAAVADAVLRLIQPGAEWDAWSERARARYEMRFTEAHFQKRLLEALGVNLPSRLR